MPDDVQSQPLAGLRVLDMTSLAMGPLAAQILGDYGADVIKVEPPSGDAFRHTLPTVSAEMGHVYLQFNRNKRSLAIDLKAPAARDAFQGLIKQADIIVSNVRPSGMRGLGLDYAAVAAVNPAIIYCAAYGFSERGPYAGRPAADDTIQAMSGLVSLQGRTTGTPQFVASIVADKAAGLSLTNAILAALIHRMKTGRGQFIELSMFDTMVAFVMPEHLGGLSYDPPRGDSGYSRIMSPMRRPFETKDGYLSVLPYTGSQWQRFLRMIDRADLADDPELTDSAKRNARIDELYGLIEQAMPARTTADWVTALLDADILIGEVLTPEQLMADPHLAATGLFAMVDHPTEGRIRLINPAVYSSEHPTRIALLPPTLGQHSREILGEAGLDAETIEELIRAGHILAPS
jgi:crotonobetainyl-CoA:carnitine CoA-transferase CaiB-like acyl-CoA transferase